jgi:glycosyltransferase involved in cell wall biosynthesis
MKLSYFTNNYPKASHSFIRREILAIESLGHEVERIALRTDESQIVDEQDKQEQEKTTYLLAVSKHVFLINVLKVFLGQPINAIKVLFSAISLGLRSDRGLFLHIIYFLEACVLLRWQEENEIDHVHAHFGTNSTMVVMLAKQLGGASYSFTVHGPEEFDKPEFIHLAEKIKNSKFVVAITSFCKSQLFRLVDSGYWSKIQVVHCGLDEKFLGAQNTVFESSNKLVCVGRLCEQKGQLLLVEAFGKVLKTGIECELILAGDGEMRPQIESKITELGLTDYVTITGWIDSSQVKDYILQSKAMVLPSFAEGLPVVIMEALALKRPVISTYIAGIPELVVPNENGWLIPAGDVDALAQTIVDVMELDDETLANMGENGYKSVSTEHNISIEAQKLVDLFKGRER